MYKTSFTTDTKPMLLELFLIRSEVLMLEFEDFFVNNKISVFVTCRIYSVRLRGSLHRSILHSK